MKISFQEIGTGKPILLLHGFPLSHKMWSDNVDAVAGENFRLILPDLRGFGESAIDREHSDMEDMANDVAELLESLNIEKAIIGGLSMGGYVALNLYRLHPEKFAALILCDTNSSADSEEKKKTRLDLIQKIDEHGSKALVEHMLPNLPGDYTKKHNPQIISQLEKMFLECDPKAAKAALTGMARRKDHDFLLEKINVPTALIFGNEDKLTNIETAQSLKSKIHDSELFIIENAGHFSNLEQPGSFNKALVGFIKTVKF